MPTPSHRAPSLRTGHHFTGDTRRTAEKDRAKELLPIWKIWEHLGLPYPPHKDGACRSPFHEDRTPSFSIGKGGTVWHDFTTGEGGDAVRFIEKVRHCTTGEAIRTLIDMAGTRPTAPHRHAWPTARKVSAVTPARKPLPALRIPTPGELAALTVARRLGPSWAGLELMVRRGLLFTAPEVFDLHPDGSACFTPAFVATDSARRCAMMRRTDGIPWRCIGEKKSRTWSAGEGDSRHPIGAALLAGELRDAPLVILTEGLPDMLAAHALAWDALGDTPDALPAVAILGMVSASVSIHPESLPLFSGRAVRIVPHCDGIHHATGKDAGEDAAQRWASALHDAGASVSFFRLHRHLPSDGKDLCDATAHAFANHPAPVPLPLSLSLISHPPLSK